MAPLHIIIVGGGFAGMICARVLREHHNVTVFERSPRPHSHGTGINISPNAYKILDSLGFSNKRARGLRIERYRRFDRLGGLMQDDSLLPADQSCGRLYTEEWIDGWRELMRLATAPSDELGLAGNRPTFMWGSKIVDIDVERGIVQAADGREAQGDLIVVADGISSKLRRKVVESEQFSNASRTGTSAFRLTLAAKDIEAAVGKIRVMDPTKPPTFDVYMTFDGGRRGIIMYPCRNFELLNINMIAPDDRIRWMGESHSSLPADRENLIDIFSDFSPLVVSILRYIRSATIYPLRDERPLPTFFKGRTLLVGDAAHPMTPHQGQGPSQGVEDAEALRLFNDRDVDRSSVSDTLKLIDSVRRPRASHVQTHTRVAEHEEGKMALLTHMLYNWQYPGIHECLRRLDAGQEMLSPVNPLPAHWIFPS